MKKIKKKYNDPNYNRKVSPFIIRLEAAVLRDGFEDVKDFIRYHINKGKSFRDIHALIEKRYDLKVHWMTIYRNLRKLAPPTYNRKTMGHFKRRSITTSRGNTSVTFFINDLIRKGYDKCDFARVFKIREDSVTGRLESIYPVKLNGNEVFPEKKILKIMNIKRYCEWLCMARKIGFDSVIEAILYLYEDKEMVAKNIAWIFKTSGTTMQNKIKICIKEKSKLKGEENGNCTNRGTDV